MALILEVLTAGRGGEVRERHRLDGAPVAIGRALENQVVLDDPHVDARHARLDPTEDGGWMLVDLGSVNRIGVATDGTTDRLVVAPGVTVTLGRTTLRFRDEFAPIAPALPLVRAETPRLDWLGSRSGRGLALLGSVLFGAVYLWSNSTERGTGSSVFTSILVALVLISMWAGTWAIASRVVLGRFNYAAHEAIAAVMLVASTLVTEFGSWWRFLFPATDWFGGFEVLLQLLIVGALIALHLSQSSHLARLARWRIGGIAVVTALALTGVGAALDEDEFSPMAEYPGDVKTVMPSLVPQQDPTEFAATRATLKEEVDKLLEKRDP